VEKRREEKEVRDEPRLTRKEHRDTSELLDRLSSKQIKEILAEGEQERHERRERANQALNDIFRGKRD
jgi:hypothetical protein